MNNLQWNEFKKVDMRVGTIISVEPFPEAINPSYKIKIDFGVAIGIKKTSAQLTKRYQPEDLLRKQVIAVVNFPPKQIANFMSECLLLGAVNDQDVIIIQPEQNIPNGWEIG